MTWNSDMSAAPRDGTPLLLWTAGDYVIGYFETAKGWPSSKAGFNDWTTGITSAGQYDCGYERIGRPTKWMHLPAPPEDTP